MIPKEKEDFEFKSTENSGFKASTFCWLQKLVFQPVLCVLEVGLDNSHSLF